MRDLIGFTHGNSLRARVLRQKKYSVFSSICMRRLRDIRAILNLILLLFSHGTDEKNTLTNTISQKLTNTLCILFFPNI